MGCGRSRRVWCGCRSSARRGDFVVGVLPASLVAALGQAPAFNPSLGTAISSAKPEIGGLASGIVNTSYQIGSALGQAAMTAVGVSFRRGADRRASPLKGYALHAAFRHFQQYA